MQDLLTIKYQSNELQEADFGGASLSDSWFNTTAYGSISFDDLMASLSGDIISSESDNLLDADGSFAEGGATPIPFTSPESPASSSSSDSGSDRRQSNPIPRHKRPSHKRAELKRRDKIKVNLFSACYFENKAIEPQKMRVWSLL